MYILKTKNTKTDPITRWNLPERVFFACGACHILAYAFSQKYSETDFEPIWIKPTSGFTGNHVVMVRDNIVFDYHGYSDWNYYFDRYKRKAIKSFANWDASLHQLPIDVLISNPKSREYEGLWLRQPNEFLHNALPRTETYLDKFISPSEYFEQIVR